MSGVKTSTFDSKDLEGLVDTFGEEGVEGTGTVDGRFWIGVTLLAEALVVLPRGTETFGVESTTTVGEVDDCPELGIILWIFENHICASFIDDRKTHVCFHRV